MIKPRTQVLSQSSSKGVVVRSGTDLAVVYRRFVAKNHFGSEVTRAWPGVDRPMLQEYLPDDADRIYCVSGFVTRDGKQSATRAAYKVLSTPRRLGVGLCAEPAPIDRAIEEALLNLCRNVGYFGMFQCEFLMRGERRLLIDFNPRCYNWMALTVRRGLHLPVYSYLAAIGDGRELERNLALARLEETSAMGVCYCHTLKLAMQLGVQRLYRRATSADSARWKEWRETADEVVDPAWQQTIAFLRCWTCACNFERRSATRDRSSAIWRLCRR